MDHSEKSWAMTKTPVGVADHAIDSDFYVTDK